MDLAGLRQFNANLSFEPLDPDTENGQKWYVPLWEHGTAPTDELLATIELSDDRTSAQLLTGPDGSGKTTELLRLRDTLLDRGYQVARVDMTEYLDMDGAINIVDFLTAVALGVVDELPAADGNVAKGRFERLLDLLKRVRVSVDKVGLDFGVASVDLKTQLKGNPDFVRRLRAEVEPNLAQFAIEIRQFIAAAGAEADQPLVLIVDQGEKLGGDDQAMGSVRDLFAHHSARLLLPGVHVVYTVPAYLAALLPAFAQRFDGAVRQILTLKLTDRYTGAPIESCLAKLIEIVSRREPAWNDVFTDDQLRRLILLSGGNVRDLFRLLKEAILKAFARHAELPITDDLMDEAVRAVRADFGQMTAETGDILSEVKQAQGNYVVPEQNVQRVARLMRQHVLLPHLNGTWWYEIHPLALPFVT